MTLRKLSAAGMDTTAPAPIPLLSRWGTAWLPSTLVRPGSNGAVWVVFRPGIEGAPKGLKLMLRNNWRYDNE